MTPLAAQTPSKPVTPVAGRAYVTPKTPWGDPDLRGVYTNNDESGIPFERPAQFDGKRLQDISEAELNDLREERAEQAVERAPTLGGAPGVHNPVHWFENFNAQNSRAWLITDPPDGHVPPMTAEGQRRAAIAAARPQVYNTGSDSYEERGLYDRCVTRGIPGSMMPAIYGNAYEILQGPGYAAILYEMIHEARIIPIDGTDRRPHSRVKTFMGDARAHWDGNTLVVETTNFDERTAYRGATSTLKLTERFTRTAPNLVEWSVTSDDPRTWTRPWTFAMNLKKDASQRPFEYACHEGNYGLKNILSAARSAERDAAKNATKD